MVRKKGAKRHSEIRVADLFAGVGGFRLGLNGHADYKFVWSNQWEPGGDSRQFAFRCYSDRFSEEGEHFNFSIERLLDEYESGARNLVAPDLIVGGFPCQDYSVAKFKNQSRGILGKKGVLWWQIHRLLRLLKKRHQPARALLLENVDRLLKSPSSQPGRDFAVMLRSLTDLGYVVEWRVVNAADYGFPQRRRRVFMVALLTEEKPDVAVLRLGEAGVLEKAFRSRAVTEVRKIQLSGSLADLSEEFSKGDDTSPFANAGVAVGKLAFTRQVTAKYSGKKKTLASVIKRTTSVPAEYFVADDRLPLWERMKGSKKIPRSHLASGTNYVFSEGKIAFPDHLDRPARTVLTSEGGVSPSRTKHIIRHAGRWRRLVPEELEALNGFRRGWTDTGMSPVQRAFCMGNALVVGVVRRIAGPLKAEIERL